MKICKDIAFWAWLTLLFFIIGRISGQTNNDTIHLREIEIPGQLPNFSQIQSMELDSIILKNAGNKNLATVLNSVPSVQIKSYGIGGIATASFRGANASHTQILWNGIPLNSPMLGQTDLSLIPAGFADKISISEGANGMVKTTGALGGIIELNNTITDSNHLSLFQGIGSFGSYCSRIDSKYSIGNIAASTKLFYNTSQNNFSYQNTALLPSAEMKMKDAGFTSIAILQGFTLDLQTSSLSLYLWQNMNDRNIPPIMTNVEAANHEEKQSENNTRIAANWKRQNKKLSLELNSGFVYTELAYHLYHFFGSDTLIGVDSKSFEKSNYSKIEASYTLVNHFHIYTSLNYSFSDALINEAKYDQGYHKDRHEFNGMAGIEYSGKTASITSLVRESITDGKASNLMPMAQFVYAPHKIPGLEFKIAGGVNYHFPTLNDLYFVPGGNPLLKPEKGFTQEAGIYFSPIKALPVFSTRLNFELTAFKNEITDWIRWYPTQFGYWTPENIDQVNSYGIELTGGLKSSINKIKINFRAGYIYHHATARSGDIEILQPAYLPRHNFNAFINLEFKKWFLLYNQGYTSERPTNDKTGNYNYILPSYSLAETSAGRRFFIKKHSLDLKFSVNNLYNKTYQQILWRAMPGRNYSISATWTIK